MNYSIDWDGPGERDRDEDDLLPCPFCGGAPDYTEAKECGDGAYVVTCPNCQASSMVAFASKDDPRRKLTEAWNRRASPWRPIESSPKDGATVEVRGVMRVHHMRGCKFPIMPKDWRPDTPDTEWRLTDWREVGAPSSEQAAAVATEEQGIA
jgi:Lar family restriction alleviation protein